MPRAQIPAVLTGGIANGYVMDAGAAPSQAMAMTYLSSADAFSLMMSNAASAQQRGQVMAGAALAKVLVLILAAG